MALNISWWPVWSPALLLIVVFLQITVGTCSKESYEQPDVPDDCSDRVTLVQSTWGASVQKFAQFSSGASGQKLAIEDVAAAQAGKESSSTPLKDRSASTKEDHVRQLPASTALPQLAQDVLSLARKHLPLFSLLGKAIQEHADSLMVGTVGVLALVAIVLALLMCKLWHDVMLEPTNKEQLSAVAGVQGSSRHLGPTFAGMQGSTPQLHTATSLKGDPAGYPSFARSQTSARSADSTMFVVHDEPLYEPLVIGAEGANFGVCKTDAGYEVVNNKSAGQLIARARISENSSRISLQSALSVPIASLHVCDAARTPPVSPIKSKKQTVGSPAGIKEVKIFKGDDFGAAVPFAVVQMKDKNNFAVKRYCTNGRVGPVVLAIFAEDRFASIVNAAGVLVASLTRQGKEEPVHANFACWADAALVVCAVIAMSSLRPS